MVKLDLTTCTRVKMGRAEIGNKTQVDLSDIPVSGDQVTPQAFVADSSGQKRVFVNHQGDGSIWAFDIKYVFGSWQAIKVPGYPLKTQGRITEACAITDLEGDDTLDLTAVDDAGYIYAWKLGQGSVYEQPWPVQYGNNWNTSNNAYKDPGAVGYLYEDWKALRPAPSYWLESGSGNACDTVIENFSFSIDNGTLVTASADANNLHFVGPSTSAWKDYTVSGKIKFDSANARFGINVYSSYADSAKKYSIIRRPDGKVEWVHYTAPGTDTVLAESDTIVVSDAGVWYNYKIFVQNQTSYNDILADFWPEGEADLTSDPNHVWDITATDATPSSARLIAGRVGVMTDSGTGTRYWGPITVVTNTPAGGAYLAYEHFIEDTVVDIAPYTPRNWSPDYSSVRFATGYDTTGFVFNKTDTNLIYKHRPGAQYPVVCQIAPYTNLTWKNYDYSGKIVKPEGSVYDSIWIGLDVYSSDSGMYRFKFRNDTMMLSGGRFSDTVVNLSSDFDNGDELYFTISTISWDIPTLPLCSIT
ncbi:MAG: hypothetical protein JW768_02800 [Chitinispirillaceae bacterium]|nr:hypothetical protein [Chitinispirillaceae bacterium]